MWFWVVLLKARRIQVESYGVQKVEANAECILSSNQIKYAWDIGSRGFNNWYKEKLSMTCQVLLNINWKFSRRSYRSSFPFIPQCDCVFFLHSVLYDDTSRVKCVNDPTSFTQNSQNNQNFSCSYLIASPRSQTHIHLPRTHNNLMGNITFVFW